MHQEVMRSKDFLYLFIFQYSIRDALEHLAQVLGMLHKLSILY